MKLELAFTLLVPSTFYGTLGFSAHRQQSPLVQEFAQEQLENERVLPAWDSLPRPDDTGHLIFDTVGNLLKHWSNTYYQNGHTVVPAVIAPGTLVFHGRMDAIHHPGPEWLSFDAEHALYFAPWDGHLFTYVAKRELRVLYFDGSSAAKMHFGSLDSQDIVGPGNISQFPLDDRRRIRSLCTWGRQYNLDGFIRMEFDFEIMYCNFTNGLELVSDVAIVPAPFQAASTTAFHHDRFTHSNRTELNMALSSLPSDPLSPPEDRDDPENPRPNPPPGSPRRRPPAFPPGWKGSLRNPNILVFEAAQAGSWHNFVPVTGVRLDYSKLLTFYDPKYQSLVKSRRKSAARSKHRLLNISRDDAQAFKRDLHDVLTRSAVETGSGVNWGEVIRHIVERYAERIEFLGYLLRSLDSGVDAVDVVKDVRLHVLNLLSPYLSPTSIPSVSEDVSNRTWLASTMKRCSLSYTSHIDIMRFTAQEDLIKEAIDQTVGQICRTLGVIWLTAFTAESIMSPRQRWPILLSWREEVERLQDWLGWAQWKKCDPMCAADEICSVPQWPFDLTLDLNTTPHCLSKLHSEFRGRSRPNPDSGTLILILTASSTVIFLAILAWEYWAGRL